jgi:hypothetical protein
LKFQKDGSNNYLFQEMSSITEKSQFQKLRMGYRRDTREDRMMMERYSKNPVQSLEEIQERTG